MINVVTMFMNYKTIIVYLVSPSIPKLSTIPEKPWFVGNTTNVLCLSEEGKPKSEFQWSVNGQLKMENNSVLPIGPLTKTDDKIEVFCNVMNEYTTRHEITLTSEPLHLDVECNYDLYEPVLINWGKVNLINSSDNITTKQGISLGFYP